MEIMQDSTFQNSIVLTTLAKLNLILTTVSLIFIQFVATLTSARNYGTIVSKVESNSSHSEEEDDEDDDPIVFREKLQKSMTIRIPKPKEGTDSADVIDNESSEKFAFNVAQKRMSLFQPTNQLSKEENDQLKDALKETSRYPFFIWLL